MVNAEILDTQTAALIDNLEYVVGARRARAKNSSLQQSHTVRTTRYPYRCTPELLSFKLKPNDEKYRLKCMIRWMATVAHK